MGHEIESVSLQYQAIIIIIDSFPSHDPKQHNSGRTNVYCILPNTRGCDTSAMLMKISSAG